jgi:hypothetical protein
MKTVFRMAVAALPLAFSFSVQAEVHRCKDEKGKTFFSDRGCPGGEKMRGAPGGASHTIGTAEDDADVARRCLEQFASANGGSVERMRVESHRVKWVTVRDIGARRLFSVTIGFLAPGGYLTGETTEHECLMRGDNVTFQTTPYELVK